MLFKNIADKSIKPPSFPPLKATDQTQLLVLFLLSSLKTFWENLMCVWEREREREEEEKKPQNVDPFPFKVARVLVRKGKGRGT